MFNFNDLDIEKDTDNSHDSFVGIRKSNETNRMTFYLPKGFESFEVNYENVKNLFFSMYKTFKRFEVDNISNFDKMLDKEGRNRDNTYSRDFRGYSFSNEEDNNKVLLYSKIDIIDNFFAAQKDLEVDSIVQRIGSTESINYSDIEKLLNDGVFLKNHAFFINDNLGKKNVIENSISELVELYCYIYKELLIELDSEINPIVSEVANNFSYKHLTSLQSLFNKDTYELTVLILKDCLDIIDKHTAYKDYLYYKIYDVIEQFLYGQLSSDDNNNGGFWGINNFSYIWEDMCNSFVLSDTSKKVLYCDSSLNNKYISYVHENLQKKRFGGYSVYIDKEFTNNFYIELDGHKRWIRPDLIVRERESGIENENTLDFLISQKLLFIKKSTPHRLLNFGDKNINVEISIKNYTGKEGFSALTNKVFNKFTEKFSNLHRNKSTTQGTLKGYRYTPKGKHAFSLSNISEDKFNEVYQEIYNGGKNAHGNSECEIYIVDWKYVPSNFFTKKSKKLKIDIVKQLTYEFCIIKNEDPEIKIVSQFCIPKFCNSEYLVIGEDKLTIAESGIHIISLNFNFLQKNYVNIEMGLF